MTNRNKRKKSLWIFNTFSVPRHVCADDTCIQLTPTPTPFHVEKAESQSEEVVENESFYIPVDLLDALKLAYGKGCFYTFLCTVSEEFLTDKLISQGCNKRQIYLANLAAKTLILLCATRSAKTLMTPTINYLLTEFAKISESNAGYITAGLVIALEAMTSPASLSRTAAVITAGFAGSLLGNVAGKLSFGFIQSAHEKVKNTVTVSSYLVNNLL